MIARFHWGRPCLRPARTAPPSWSVSDIPSFPYALLWGERRQGKLTGAAVLVP